jgi:hypothetical protein
VRDVQRAPRDTSSEISPSLDEKTNQKKSAYLYSISEGVLCRARRKKHNYYRMYFAPNYTDFCKVCYLCWCFMSHSSCASLLIVSFMYMGSTLLCHLASRICQFLLHGPRSVYTIPFMVRHSSLDDPCELTPPDLV